mmetsp:Transcript_72978/g.188251  ORF Transcript_72978/g.188251 Transcript_72978/m.188251 type:complete len:519 (+) Transcript_72978:95-1651(+)
MGSSNSVNASEVDVSTVDFQAVRRDVLKIMDSPEWDDGSRAPLLIRLAWHSSGTYCAKDGTGGSNGATMRHSKEASDPENNGLEGARKLLEPIQAKYKGISYADLWVLAAYCAIEHTGGPVIEFRGGRRDAPESKAIAPGRLPGAEKGTEASVEADVDEEGRIKGWEKNAAHVREVFSRMGFSDREVVALLCGGHVYGRCHPDSSGYAGAWVENPTRFSNEYAADMVGDKWILVGHDTKMPDGGCVPEEVRPAPGKKQYIDLSKYEGESGGEAVRSAPDAKEYPAGKYVCVSDWVNVRAMPDTSSPIIGRFNKDEEINLVAVKVFGTAIRGFAERGGWVSIIASGGKTLFERQGDHDCEAMAGRYRAGPKAVPVFAEAEARGSGESQVHVSEKEFSVSKVKVGRDMGEEGAVFGQVPGGWALLYSPTRGLLAELIVEGYNEIPRKPIKGQTGHQMMLVSDMILLWDKGFRQVLEEYAEDQDLLSQDFGTAFKRLTELGCPWSNDFIKAGVGKCPLCVS